MFCASHRRRRRRRLALSSDRPTLSGLASCFSAYPSLPATKGEGKERFCLPPSSLFFTRHRFLPAFSTHSRKKAKHCSTPNLLPCDEPRGSLSLSNPSFPVTDLLVQMEN